MWCGSLACERLENPVDNLYYIGTAFAQVGFFDFVKLRQQHIQLLLQRPFGVAMLGFNQMPWFTR